MPSPIQPTRMAEDLAAHIPERATNLIPDALSPRLGLEGIPGPLLAVVGAVAVVGRVDVAEGAAQVPREAMRAPAAVADTAAGGARALAAWAGGAATALTGKTTAVGRSAAETYRRLTEEGRDVVVAYAAERAVRSRVSQVEDRLAPRAGRAAVLLMERRRRVQDSQRVRTAGQATRRAHRAARRGAQRFSQLNAPVLADSPDTPGMGRAAQSPGTSQKRP